MQQKGAMAPPTLIVPRKPGRRITIATLHLVNAESNLQKSGFEQVMRTVDQGEQLYSVLQHDSQCSVQ